MDEESKQRVQALVEQAEYNSPANQAIRATQQVDTRLKEMQIILASMPNVVAELRSIEENIAPLAGVLESIRDKETPEMPDYAQPIIQALNQAETTLSQAIKKIDVKPNVSVAAPEVNVSPTDVTVDLKGVEKLMKSDLPQAFKDAIKLIPKTEIPENDYSELAERLDETIEWLKSIDHQSRLKPQFPSTLKVSNLDGSVVSGGFDPNADLITDISTPDIIIETDGVKTLTTTITATTITEVWT